MKTFSELSFSALLKSNLTRHGFTEPTPVQAQTIEPALAEMLINQLAERFHTEGAQGNQPVLVCAGQIRMPLRRLLRLAVPALPILSYSELAVGTASVNALGMIDDVRNLVP